LSETTCRFNSCPMYQFMKCCKCKKEIDIDKIDYSPPAKWYGKYRSDKLLKIICADCISKPENKNWHEEE